MNEGTPVVVVADWSTFLGRFGVVTATRPFLMVLLDGESFAMRFGETEVVPRSDTQHMTAGE